MTLPKDILPQVTAGELDAFSTIGGEERLVAFVNRFRELERKRIIELLKGAQFRLLGNNDEAMAFAIQELIALIKGEQK